MTETVRVATWNVRGLRGSVAAVAGVVRAEAIDVLMVQESGPRRRLAALGAALGMSVCGDPPAFPRRRVQNAVLARFPDVPSHRLVRFDGGSLMQPRGAMIARLPGLVAASVHLGLAGAERGRHASQLLRLLRDVAEPVVIGADLNAHPDDGAPALIAGSHPDVWSRAGEGDGWTFHSDRPTARIDALFTSPAVQSLRAWTAGGRVSDHLMVVADLGIPSPE